MLSLTDQLTRAFAPDRAHVTRATQEVAQLLLEAERTRTPIKPVAAVRDLTMNDAQAAQSVNLAARLQRGEQIVGAKVALTSAQAQARTGSSEPIIGWLTSSMQVPDGGRVDRSALIAPRAEVEIVFVLGDGLPTEAVTELDVMRATAAVCVGIEIPDSRYSVAGATHVDLVADNASAGRFALSAPKLTFAAVDLAVAGAQLSLNGDVATSGAAGTVLGHPARAVAFLINALSARGLQLPPGFVVFSGAATEPLALAGEGVLEGSIAGLGHVGIRLVQP
jgi:2-keto-4-pentenoate hydratase